MNATALIHWAAAHSPWSYLGAGIAALVALVLLLVAVLMVRNAIRTAGRGRGITGLINLAALLATSVQATGMWKFFGTTMGLPVGFRIVLFGFMEIALLACGLRARANVEGGADAGVDGVLVWVLALASGVMSSTDASSPREALMRLLVAVVVALLWTRDLMAAKKAARAAGTAGKKRSGPVRWRITGERIAVALRLADAADTSVSAIESARKVVRFLKAGDRARRPRLLQWLTLSGLRADRARTRLAAHALLHHGDPTAVHTELAQRMLAEALRRLDDGPQDRDDTPAEGVDTPPVDTPALIAEGHAMAINGGALTGPKPLPQAVVKTARPTTGEAEQIIKFCWESGVGVRETARAASRDVGQVSRRFARLDERHGARARREESDEIPLVTVANGTAA